MLLEHIKEKKIADITESAATMYLYLQHCKSLAPTSESLSPMTENSNLTEQNVQFASVQSEFAL